VRSTHSGTPVLVGLAPMMTAMRAAFDYRDFRLRPPISPAAAPVGARARWTTRMQRGGALDESESLALFADYGMPVMPHRIVESATAAEAAARDVGFPAVLKTANAWHPPQIRRRRRQLNLYDAAAIRAAYDDLARRLGPRVLVTPMAGRASSSPSAPSTIRSSAPSSWPAPAHPHRDHGRPPFRPAALRRRDRAPPARPPESAAAARRPPRPARCRHRRVADSLARFSVLARISPACSREIDVNPVLCGASGCAVLDALVVGRAQGPSRQLWCDRLQRRHVGAHGGI